MFVFSTNPHFFIQRLVLGRCKSQDAYLSAVVCGLSTVDKIVHTIKSALFFYLDQRKKKPTLIHRKLKQKKISEELGDLEYGGKQRFRLSQFFFLLLLPLLRFRLQHRQGFFRSVRKRLIFSFHEYLLDAAVAQC